jgi:hypothetical protein
MVPQERRGDSFGDEKEKARMISRTGRLLIEGGLDIAMRYKSQRPDGTFERADFTYDHKRDLYICPGGKELRQRQKAYRMPRPLVDENGMMRYRASKLDCDSCSLKPRCCPNAPDP